jgi:hypothetical protein
MTEVGEYFEERTAIMEYDGGLLKTDLATL